MKLFAAQDFALPALFVFVLLLFAQ
jgi:hypothetical protein